ncbi:MAG: alpha/beta fold hydrolase [Phycisphaerales bacterium]
MPRAASVAAATAAVALIGVHGARADHPAAIRYGTVEVDGREIFYREGGDPDAPKIVLLHGFPTSSQMYDELIRDLAGEFHLIAPDFPGFGQSSMPSRGEYDYTFDHLAADMRAVLEARGFDRYVLYVMDYGAPVGFRIATAHPERVRGLIVQNGNAYEEGLAAFWDPIKAYWASNAQPERDALRAFLTRDATIWQYTHGTRNPASINPDNWGIDQPLLDRPGNDEIQLDLFLDYGTNPALYPAWQQWMREAQPPTLIVWGKNDEIFPASGATPYLRDLPDAELHLLDTGHFALEEEGDFIAERIRNFMRTRIAN